MRLKIRPFRPEDLEQLTRFWKAVESDPIVSGDFSSPTDENVARWKKYVMNVLEEDENQILVAEINRKPVGYIFFLKQAKVPLETKYIWGTINELYVHPTYRRKGIATKLMQQTFNYLKSVGVTHVRINVMIKNYAAINLYRKLGFRDLQLKMQMRLN